MQEGQLVVASLVINPRGFTVVREFVEVETGKALTLSSVALNSKPRSLLPGSSGAT
jgi:hypothetical protein